MNDDQLTIYIKAADSTPHAGRHFDVKQLAAELRAVASMLDEGGGIYDYEARTRVAVDELTKRTLSFTYCPRVAKTPVEEDGHQPPKVNLDEIDRRVGERVEEYKKYWNADTGRYEIDKGDPLKEWICTEDELYDDVRRSVEDELAS